MKGLGRCENASAYTRPKTRGVLKALQWRSLLSSKDCASSLGESAADLCAQLNLHSFGDEAEMRDDDPAVASTVEELSVSDCDVIRILQKKEARTMGGTPSL
jgi:hypothetical protein